MYIVSGVLSKNPSSIKDRISFLRDFFLETEIVNLYQKATAEHIYFERTSKQEADSLVKSLERLGYSASYYVSYRSVALACPTEAQVRAMLETARTYEMSNVENVICDDAFVLVRDAVNSGKVSWDDVMWDTRYVVAQVFDDYFNEMGLDENGCLPEDNDYEP